MTKSCIISLLVWGIVRTSCAQADREAVYAKKISELEIEVSAGVLKVREHYSSDKIFYRNFDKHTRESVYYSDFDPIIRLEAQTLTPEGSGFKKTKVSTIETKDIVQPGIFYGGYKRRDFAFPVPSAGAIGRLEYSKSIKDVHLLTPFYFDDEIDVKHSQFSVTFPKNVNIRYKVFGDPETRVKFDSQNDKDKTKYSWTLTDVPAYRSERSAPSRSFSAPHIVIMVDSYDANGKTYKISSDVSDLYGWYSSLVKEIPAVAAGGSLKETVDLLTGSLKTDEEKIRAIFQWVQRSIKYVAFENGMAGFIPRAADDVYNKRYGDCKDMANLLKAMINQAGMDAYLTWIGTRSKPYLYKDVPTAVADNHMICSVRMNGQFVFLDATNSYLAFGRPSSMIQGKEALIGINDQEFEIVKVPVVGQKENIRFDSVRIVVDGDGIRGRYNGILCGYKKDDIEVRQLSAQLRNDQNYIRDFFGIGNDNIDIDSVSVLGLGNQDAPAISSFMFFQPGYHKRVGDRIYLNMNLNKRSPGEKIDLVSRAVPLESDYCYEDRTVTVFTLPQGYTVNTLPPVISKLWKEFGVSCKYTVSGNTVILEKVLYADFLYLDKPLFAQWNEFLQVLSDINQQSVVISRSK